MSHRLRLARPGDADALPTVERLGGEAFRAITDLAWVADDNVMSAAAHLPLIADGTVWVAEDEAGVVGFLSAERSGRDLHICNISVLPERQRGGIGRALIECAVAEAKRSGVHALTLTTFRDLKFNELFYASLGFERLEAGELNARLKSVLEGEAAAGLPVERRCAMRLIVANGAR